MKEYDVQVTTNLGDEINLHVWASSEEEAELTAKNIMEDGAGNITDLYVEQSYIF
jgi:hypothetical protein